MKPFDFWKEVYLLFGDNFDWQTFNSWDDDTGVRSMSEVTSPTWGFREIEGYTLYMTFDEHNNVICKFTDKFWKELEDENRHDI